MMSGEIIEMSEQYLVTTEGEGEILVQKDGKQCMMVLVSGYEEATTWLSKGDIVYLQSVLDNVKNEIEKE